MKIYREKSLGTEILSEQLKLDQDFIFDYELKPLDELLKSDFDIIELSEATMQQALQSIKMLDWEIQSTMACDAFVKKGEVFKPFHLNASAFKNYLELNLIRLDVSKSAVLVGEYSFLITFAIALSKIGYKKLFLVSSSGVSYEKQLKGLKNILFDLSLMQISYDEMASITEISSLLIIDFSLEENSELVEILTYFNFLSENAIFLDLRQYMNSSLAFEADKANLKIINSVDFHRYKYNLIKK